MLSKKQLSIMLSKLRSFSQPKASLEQYPTFGEIAADILNFAVLEGDIEGKRVLDLGCGTGMLAIGAMLSGAAEVLGVDIDEEAVKLAEENTKAAGVVADYVVQDVKNFTTTKKYDTVLMNPPFGVQKKGADRIFLEKALEHADVVYTIHKKDTLDWVSTFVSSLGAKITNILPYAFPIPATMSFHKQKTHRFEVVVVRIVVII